MSDQKADQRELTVEESPSPKQSEETVLGNPNVRERFRLKAIERQRQKNSLDEAIEAGREAYRQVEIKVLRGPAEAEIVGVSKSDLLQSQQAEAVASMGSYDGEIDHDFLKAALPVFWQLAKHQKLTPHQSDPDEEEISLREYLAEAESMLVERGHKP